ncbi:hypothetical protein [Brachybacterium hainanense]|uniref:Uncharacterized protein n=1 Tax=Brachybacterium hainanense TaxID=1541174 RepID=A0ABV6RF41_9MICO
MRSTLTQTLAGIVAVAAVLAASSCTAVPGNLLGAGGSALETALAHVPAGQGAEAELLFSDMAATRTLQELPANEDPNPFSQLAGIGLGPLRAEAASSPGLVPAVGAEDAVALSIGMPPQTSFRFTGMDEGAVVAAFGEGGERSTVGEGELVERRGAHELDPDDELGHAASLGSLNTVWYHDDVLVGSSDPATVRAWAQPEQTLAETGTYDALASCLGPDAVSAYLTAEGAADLPGGATGLAIATTGTSIEDWSEVLCVETGDEQEARDLAAAAEAQIADGTDPWTLEAWTEILGPAEVTTDGAMVRITSTQRGGIFLDIHQKRSLPGLLGASG